MERKKIKQNKTNVENTAVSVPSPLLFSALTFQDPKKRKTKNTVVAYGGPEVGRRKGAEEVVVIWADSVALVWFV